jgi:hypothetical protein
MSRFFKDERAKMLKESSSNDANNVQKVSFESMAQTIGAKWRQIEQADKARYQAIADKEKLRYSAEKEVYMQKQRDCIEQSRERLQATVADDIMQQYLASGGGSGKQGGSNSGHCPSESKADCQSDSE